MFVLIANINVFSFVQGDSLLKRFKIFKEWLQLLRSEPFVRKNEWNEFLFERKTNHLKRKEERKKLMDSTHSSDGNLNLWPMI